jgi:hypothetical protein
MILNLGGPMIAEYTGTVPRRGDRVRLYEHPSLFEVVDVNMLMQTANLKSTDVQGRVTRNVAWSSLEFQSVASRMSAFVGN